MRVLQILNDDQRGGVQVLAELIEEGLRPHGITFATEYLFPGPGTSLLEKLSCAAAMARRIWRGDFDALITYQATSSILAGALGWLAGCRLRIVHQTCTPGEIALPIRLMDRLVGALGLYTVNIANSAATWAEFKDYPARYRRAMVLIEHGLDPPAPTHTRGETRRRFALPATRPLVLNVGRLVPQKNQDVLIQALVAVPHAHLAVAGGGPKADAYRALARELGVADRVHLLGVVSSADVADLYAAADLFVFPSTWETFGLAAVEAAMSAVPVVAADLAVLREVLATEAAEGATFVAPHDIDGWARAIRINLETPPAAAALREFATEVAARYSRERMSESYRRLLGSGSSWSAWGIAQEISA
jgi:glycosyltransferase involved in cell wall biosynthesis